MDMEKSLRWGNIDNIIDNIDVLVDDLGSDFSDEWEHEHTTLDPSALNTSRLAVVVESEAKMVMYIYDCPVCGKALKTAGGFRGHIAKQHKEMDHSSFKGTFQSHLFINFNLF
jgi:hypothetical protein